MNIYLLQNIITGKRYVGMTVHEVKKRFLQHCRIARKNPKTLLHKAINKYGFRCWEVTVLESGFASVHEMAEAEIAYIHILKPELNMATGGLGGDTSDSPNFTKYIQSRDIAGPNHPMFGKKHAQASKSAISAAKTGVSLSPQHKLKAVFALRANPPSSDCIKRRSQNKSKTYKITEPTGEVLIVKNLTKFCKERNLNQGNMNNVALGRYKSSKGYKVEALD